MPKENRKMLKIKERDWRYLKAVMEMRNCPTQIDTVSLIFDEHKRHSKDPLVKAQDEIMDAEEEAEKPEQKKFLAQVRRVLALSNGHEQILEKLDNDFSDFVEGLEKLREIE